MTRSELIDRMTVLLGGRAAEVAIVRQPTTGAADDLQRATEIARAMVTRYGMTTEVGQASFIAERPRYLELPGTGANPAAASEETSAAIDKALSHLIDQAFARATAILKLCEAVHREAAQRLLEKETLVADELAAISEAVRQCVKGKLEPSAS